jgi:hypothetical protein
MTADEILSWCRKHFPAALYADFSPNHYEIARLIVDAIESEERGASKHLVLIPRGGGKTTLSLCIMTYLVLHGIRRHVILACASGALATELLGRWLALIDGSPTIRQEYPVMDQLLRYSISPQRYHSIVHNGKKVFASIRRGLVYVDDHPDGIWPGFAFRALSVAQALRGLQVVIRGRPMRPDFILIDDPQDRGVAKSPSRTRKVVETIKRDMSGLANLGTSIPIVCLGTIITSGDVVDTLAHDTSWRVTHRKFLEGITSAPEMWAQYMALYLQSPQEAHKYYAERREIMDRGLSVTWEASKAHDDISAIETAMRIRYMDPDFFQAELQNEVATAMEARSLEYNHEDLERAISEQPRFVPLHENSLRILAIDLGSVRNWWAVFEATPEAMHILAYGSWPELASNDENSGVTLAELYADLDEPNRVMKGLDAIIAQVRERTNIDAVVINPYQVVRNRVMEYCYRTKAYCYFGRYSTPDNPFKVFGSVQKSSSWGIAKDRQTNYPVFHVDVNYWKSRFAQWVKSGKISIHSGVHSLLIRSLLSEHPIQRETKTGQKYYIWQHGVGGAPNHWFDCCVMAMAVASKEGVIEGIAVKKVRFRELAEKQLHRSRVIN